MKNISENVRFLLDYLGKKNYGPIIEILKDKKLGNEELVILLYSYVKEKQFFEMIVRLQAEIENRLELSDESADSYPEKRRNALLSIFKCSGSYFENLKRQVFMSTNLFTEICNSQRDKIVLGEVESVDLQDFAGFELIFIIVERIRNNLNTKTDTNCSLEAEKTKNLYEMLERCFELHQPSTNYIFYLLNIGIDLELIKKLIKNQPENISKDFCFFLVCKKLMISGEIDWVFDILFGDQEEMEQNKKKVSCEFLLDKLDDWDIYKFLIENKIKIESKTEKKTLNFLYYEFYFELQNIKSLKAEKISTEVLESVRKSFFTLSVKLSKISDLERVFEDYREICDQNIEEFLKYDDLMTSEEISGKYKKLQCFLLNHYENNCQYFYSEYLSNPSNQNLKYLISNLIATKQPENILLSLFLILSHMNSENQPSVFDYELELTTLFIFRYFLYLPGIVEQIEKLQIREIQIVNLMYFLTDIELFYDKNSSERIRNNRINCIFEQIEAINLSMSLFINRGKMDMAHSMMTLKRDLLKKLSQDIDNPLFPTVFKFDGDEKTQKTICENEMLQNFLGNKCQWLFSRNVAQNCYRFQHFTAKETVFQDKYQSSSEDSEEIERRRVNKKKRKSEIRQLLTNDFQSFTTDQSHEEFVIKLALYQTKITRSE